MKYLGQHFLKNKSAIKKIIAALDLRSGDTVVEIGAGHGELTEGLNNELRIKNYGIKMLAIEKDGELADQLKEKFVKNKNLEIIKGDALRVLPSLIHNSSFLIHDYKFTGNIPYYITGKLLRTIGELENKPELCVFTLQKEVAERITAVPPKMNRLAASVQFWAKPEIMGHISRKDFEPQPEVDSAIIRLTRTNAERTRTDAENYYRAVKVLFQQPRKTILNNLANCKAQIANSKEEITRALEQIGINPQDRPQNLSVDNILQISRLFNSTGQP